jgi:hypothetical protein
MVVMAVAGNCLLQETGGIGRIKKKSCNTIVKTGVNCGGE